MPGLPMVRWSGSSSTPRRDGRQCPNWNRQSRSPSTSTRARRRRLPRSPDVFAQQTVVEGVDFLIGVVLDREGAATAVRIALELHLGAEGATKAVFEADLLQVPLAHGLL